ncbi:hypothetical protein ASPVEDRAFT_620006 [Aspergillus versicolor CBS 583.65]|uniref:Uncharacterized protein n=1 Tax=Aspergillus versicolor CBS 583.65 TaxID=1036611 RepID=A0A1L9PI28_ASPVE|nr:uncharacterized protein ASPVEDRAFT_620006 [Aspergillus versicolor CBS 583.65]OJJ01152.1 hypothetical protein ASPVEDRAFT_620006 [Aspergillus versicolor CBS 583.65]
MSEGWRLISRWASGQTQRRSRFHRSSWSEPCSEWQLQPERGVGRPRTAILEGPPRGQQWEPNSVIRFWELPFLLVAWGWNFDGSSEHASRSWRRKFVREKKTKWAIALTLPTNHLRTWWQNRHDQPAPPAHRNLSPAPTQTGQSVPRTAPRGRILEPEPPALPHCVVNLSSRQNSHHGPARRFRAHCHSCTPGLSVSERKERTRPLSLLRPVEPDCLLSAARLRCGVVREDGDTLGLDSRSRCQVIRFRRHDNRGYY